MGEESATGRPALRTDIGVPLPAGAHLKDGGANFVLVSRHATRVWLLLYADPAAAEPAVMIELDPIRNRTGDMWHVWVAGVEAGQAYAFRADGPADPAAGHRFDRHLVLLDPYAQAFAPAWWNDGHDAADARWRARSLVVDPHFDWQGVRPLRHPWSKTVIYEMHVRGFTMHPSSAVAHPGTFSGLVAKIPYLKALGVTSVELMPVAEYNPRELTLSDPGSGRRLRNFWGYSPVGFFAPAAGYAADPRPGAQVAEFKTMVRELHKAGIEVILDVVFNHTAEGDESGPTLHFRGMLNRIFYLLEDGDRRRYKNFSGCGNTVNCNHPVVRAFILDCLRYWALEMHVDGFRFDLASVLGRDQDGQLLPNPPLLEAIAEAAVLQDLKLIAEAWDAGGAYQVGSFPGTRWSEWNGHYRDDMRRFWRGDPGTSGAFATRLAGSADLYQHTGERTINSINFITSHDGFTLNDLVSYERKHNQANGEDGRDGSEQDLSANYGSEGATAEPAVEAVRLRQIKNMLGTLFISRGVPMLLGGDEFRRTQCGNNNAYCQDNEISWFDWDLCAANRDLVRFVRGLIAFRASHPVLARESFYTPEELAWFSPAGDTPHWDWERSLGAHVRAARDGGADLCFLANAWTEAVVFTVPAPPAGTGWRIAVDTAAPAPGDYCEPGARRPLAVPRQVPVAARALVILIAEAA